MNQYKKILKKQILYSTLILETLLKVKYLENSKLGPPARNIYTYITKILNKKDRCLMTIVNLTFKNKIKTKERQTSLDNMILLAL